MPALNVNKVTKWTVSDPKKNTRLFSSFDETLIDSFESKPLAFHFHNYGITVADFTRNSRLNSFFRILQTDSIAHMNNLTYVVSVEARDYPIYGMLYHPEYQLLEPGLPFDNSRNSDTIAICYYLSNFIRGEASFNPNRWVDLPITPAPSQLALTYIWE